MKLLITGITGFLGRHLAQLLKNDFEIKGMASSSGEFDGIEVYASNQLKQIDFEPDVVVIAHAAVSSGNTIHSNQLLFSVNVDLTEKIINKFPKAYFVYVSSVSIFSPQKGISEFSKIAPQSNYSLSKYWGEKIVLSKDDACVIRFPSLYGIGMKENTLIPNFVNQSLSNKKIEVWGNGQRLQNYLHIFDAAKYILKVIAHRKHLNQKVLLGCSLKEFSNIEVAQLIAEKVNAEIKFKGQDCAASVTYDNYHTLNLLNWQPEIPFKQGINKYMEWKQKQ